MRRDQRGFTLVELIIALAIVGALLAVAFGGLRVALAAWRQGEDRADVHQHARGVALAVARAVGAAYPFSASRGEAPEPEVLFRGTDRRLELVTQAPPIPFSIPIAFTAMVIELGDGAERGLVLRERALPNRNPFTDAPVALQDSAVTELTFAYLDDEGNWADSWDAAEHKALPRAVRITLTTDLNGRAETMPPITVSLRVLTP